MSLSAYIGILNLQLLLAHDYKDYCNTVNNNLALKLRSKQLFYDGFKKMLKSLTMIELYGIDGYIINNTSTLISAIDNNSMIKFFIIYPNLTIACKRKIKIQIQY